MPAPPNSTEATATVIPSLPYVATQSGIHDGGTTYDVWFKYVGQPNDGLMSISFRGSGAYLPAVTVYIDDTSSGQMGSISANRMSQIPIIDTRTFLIKVRPNVGNPNPATLDIHLEKSGVLEVIPEGALFIRAASIFSWWPDLGFTGLGAGIIDPSSGTILGFVPQFPVGESGDSLNNGIAIYGDDYGILDPTFSSLYLYDANLAQIGTVSFDVGSGTARVRASREHDKFLIGRPGSSGGSDDARYIEVTSTGVVSPEVIWTGKVGLSAIANSADDLYVYTGALGAGSTIGSPVQRYVKSTGIVETSFIAGVAGYKISDILVMSNGNLVICYYNSSTDAVIVRQYTNAGVLVNSYGAISDTFVDPRLGYGADDSVSFWLFTHLSTGFSRMYRLNLSDMSVLADITSPDSYYFDSDQGDTPAYRFVTSDSCPITTLFPPTPGSELRVSQVATERITLPPNLGGIYFINPTKATRHDSYYTMELMIPSPTIRTALIGE